MDRCKQDFIELMNNREKTIDYGSVRDLFYRIHEEMIGLRYCLGMELNDAKLLEPEEQILGRCADLANTAYLLAKEVSTRVSV